MSGVAVPDPLSITVFGRVWVFGGQRRRVSLGEAHAPRSTPTQLGRPDLESAFVRSPRLPR